MAKFAKLFDTARGQLLVTADYDDDKKEEYRISARGESLNGIVAVSSFGFEDEQERDRVFETICQDDAENQAERLFSMVNGLLG